MLQDILLDKISWWMGEGVCRLIKIVAIPKHCDVGLVIALGYPNEISIPEEMTKSVEYWVDGNNVVHVHPKKS